MQLAFMCYLDTGKGMIGRSTGANTPVCNLSSTSVAIATDQFDLVTKVPQYVHSK